MLMLIVISVIAVVSVGGSLAALRTDGYRPVPFDRTRLP
jgi:hypothetical protein